MTAWTAWTRTSTVLDKHPLHLQPPTFPKECDILLLQTVFAVGNASKPTLSLTEMSLCFWIMFVSTRLIVFAVAQ